MTPINEEQRSLDLGVEEVPITPVEIIRPRRSRERGAIGRHHRWLQGRIQSHGPELVERLIQCAMGGDMIAMRLCLERGWGTPVKAAAPIDLPPAATALEVRQAMHAVFNRVAAGEIDTQTGAELIVSYRHLLATYDGAPSLLPARPATDARQVLADRLEKLVTARPAPEPVLPPECGGR